MALFRNIVFAAALAGLIAGVFVTVVHKIGTVPIILKAETYEKAAEANSAPAAGADAATAEHHHDAEACMSERCSVSRARQTAQPAPSLRPRGVK